MNRKFNPAWLEMSKCCIKPITQVGELNAKTAANIAKCVPMELFSAKKPEELLNAQGKIITEMTNYTQQLQNILLQASNDISQQFNNMTTECADTN